MLQSGKNRIRAVVFRWCTGSYLEDQDKLRMSGIFRDAYILHRAEGHLTDYKIESDVAGGKGIVRFTADKECALSLFFGGEKVASAEGSSAVFEIENAKLWSAEQPDVYELVIFCRGEYIREYVGIRRVETDGSVLKLNGAPIKLKGVNRHSMTVNGYVETLSDLERDLKMFRKYNINAVRTSHYPPHPLFPVLCDLYGVYLMEEADLERTERSCSTTTRPTSDFFPIYLPTSAGKNCTCTARGGCTSGIKTARASSSGRSATSPAGAATPKRWRCISAGQTPAPCITRACTTP